MQVLWESIQAINGLLQNSTAWNKVPPCKFRPDPTRIQLSLRCSLAQMLPTFPAPCT